MAVPLWKRVSPEQLQWDLACELSVRELRQKYGCTKEELYCTITRFGLWRLSRPIRPAPPGWNRGCFAVTECTAGPTAPR